MMVLGLLAIVMTGLFVLLAHSFYALSHAEQHQQATSAAQYMMESIKERVADYQIGDFDGRQPSPQLEGFPPTPYPSAEFGREYWYVVKVTEIDDRLLGLVVEVHDDDRRVARLESVLKR